MQSFGELEGQIGGQISMLRLPRWVQPDSCVGCTESRSDPLQLGTKALGSYGQESAPVFGLSLGFFSSVFASGFALSGFFSPTRL